MSFPELAKSAIWAASISVPISLLVHTFSFALVHSDWKPLILILAGPGFAFLVLAESRFPDVLSDAQLRAGALIAQFLAYFAVVIVVRALIRRKRKVDGK
jgi:hypothetical protein